MPQRTKIHRLRRYGAVNVFLVEEDDGLTVIDTALKGSANAIKRAAGIIGKEIVRIVLTHAHDDHVGALDALAAAVPGAEVLISTRDARLLAGDLSLDDGEPPCAPRGGLHGAATVPARTLEDGDLVGSLRVVATPGHTPGHIALIDGRDDTVYCGDVFSTLGGLATTARVNPLFPFPALATWHPPTELDSARKLQALRPSRLAPGHGRVLDDPGRDIGLVIDKVAGWVARKYPSDGSAR